MRRFWEVYEEATGLRDVWAGSEGKSDLKALHLRGDIRGGRR